MIGRILSSAVLRLVASRRNAIARISNVERDSALLLADMRRTIDEMRARARCDELERDLAMARAALTAITPDGSCPYRHCGAGTKGCIRSECLTVADAHRVRLESGA